MGKAFGKKTIKKLLLLKRVPQKRVCGPMVVSRRLLARRAKTITTGWCRESLCLPVLIV